MGSALAGRRMAVAGRAAILGVPAVEQREACLQAPPPDVQQEDGE